MTDRELLELAAKAAGYGLPGKHYEDEFEVAPGSSYSSFHGLMVYDENTDDGCWRRFNPLDSDGDALRLAVKLGLVCSAGGQIYTNDTDLMGAWADKNVMYGTDLYQQVTWSKATGDPYAATRRAIVLAAAEIGKGLT